MFRRIFNTDYSELYNRCKHYDAISIDIFDTSLIRLVDRPEDIFKIVGEKLRLQSFATARISAQLSVENKTGVKTTINDIYQELIRNGYFDHSAAQVAMELEIETEKRMCVARRDIIDFVAKMKSMKKEIIFLSDMYLPKEYLTEMLITKGFSGFDRVIVSCDCGKNKISGDAFKYIKSIYPKRKIVHIGDNIRTDYLNAKKNGIHALLVKRIESSNLDRLLTATTRSEKSPCRWGYITMSKIEYAFLKWLYEGLKVLQPQKVLFLTREGLFFKEGFEILGLDKEFDCKIFYASRRSMLCALANSDREFVINYIRATCCSVDELFKIFSLNKEYISSICEKYRIKDSSDSLGLLPFENIIGDIIDFSEKHISVQFNLLKKYIIDLQLDGRVALVDIGWNGTMQLLMERMIKEIGINVELIGYYLGEFSGTPLKYDINKKGFLCNSCNPDKVKEVTNGAYLFEQCFTPNIGSTIGYQEKEGKITPILKEKDQDEIIREVQQGVVKALREISFFDSECELIYEKNQLLQSISYPNRDYAEMLGNIKWKDVESYRFLAKPRKRMAYIFHPNQIFEDLRKSGWKSAFLLRLFYIPFPYFRIYKKLKK